MISFRFAARFVLAMLLVALLTGCAARTVGNSSASQPVFASVTGTLTYLQHIALPPEAIVIVQLQDVTKADLPAEILAEQRLERPGQVPIAFDLRYDSRAIDPSHLYTVSVRILRGPRLLFINDPHTPVITRDHPAQVEILLKMAPQNEN